MPLPWKKKSPPSTGRISRLVSDLQAPPKRGGSLVVETGFPTSLVDLFVKNRDRLRKPFNKSMPARRRDRDRDRSGDLDPPPTCVPLLAEVPLAKIPEPEAPIVEDATVVAEAAGAIEEVPDRNGFPAAAICLVFALAAFALCTEGLVTGITIATTVLLLLERLASKEMSLA